MRLMVIAVGRVGSKSAAIQAHRCRARKYWAIARFSDDHTANCVRDNVHGLCKLHYPLGYVEDPAFGKFKTKREADAALARIEEIE